jgi:enoyl-CoA hydratase/carnithine racemase
MTDERPGMTRRFEDGVAILSFNRPEKHNAGAGDPEAWEWALRAPEVRCVIVRGEGRSFHSGRDTTLLGTRESDESDYEFVRRAVNARINSLLYAKPVIAAVKGYAIGGGFEMCLAADFRVGSTDAKLCLAEVKYGILPDTGGTQMLTTLIGPARTKYMTLTGNFLDGKTAYEWGVFDFLEEPQNVDAKALEIAKTIAARSPAAVEMGKQLVDQMYLGQVINGVRQELLAQSSLFQTEDYQEQRAALREKRDPVFKRR